MKKSINIRWLYLALGVASMLFAGIIYGWSILKAPFAGIWDSVLFGFTAKLLEVVVSSQKRISLHIISSIVAMIFV